MSSGERGWRTPRLSKSASTAFNKGLSDSVLGRDGRSWHSSAET